MDFCFPSCTGQRCLSDEAFGRAYDELTAAERAYIKTAITRCIAALGSCACPESPVTSSRRIMRQGFSLQEEVRPADWALILWDGRYSGWVRILAALLPAILAGVPNILACRLALPGAAPFPAGVLASMELAGQEQVAEMGRDEALVLLAECVRQSASGRVVLLGEDKNLDALASEAARLGLPVRRKAAPVRIAVEEGLLSPLLRFAHPDLTFLPLNAVYTPFTAVFCSEATARNYAGHVPLVLTPGMEIFWTWRDTDVAFFQEKSLFAFSGPF